MSTVDEKTVPSKESSEYAATDVEKTDTFADQNAKAASVQACFAFGFQIFTAHGSQIG